MITFEYNNKIDRTEILTEQLMQGMVLVEDQSIIQIDGYNESIVDDDGVIIKAKAPYKSVHHYLVFNDHIIPEDEFISKSEKRLLKIESDIKAMKIKTGLE